MLKVVLFSNMSEVAPLMEPKAFNYIGESQIESFESFDDFNLLAFDWYDIKSECSVASKIIIYIDEHDLFFFCKEESARESCARLVENLQKEKALSNQQLLCRFFVKLFSGDMEYLDSFEIEMNNTITQFLSGKLDFAMDEILAKRQKLLKLKRYYEQIDAVFDEMALSDNDIFEPSTVKRFTVLGARTDRYLNKVYNLQEIVSHMQETYQSQLSIQQNDLMKVFTVITAIFLPLTLLVGWYGMNFVNMPELHWKYGYFIFIGVSAAITAILVAYYKRRKWL